MISERERLRLYEQLGQTIGPEYAGTLMELLPPTSWDNIATNDQVDGLGIQLRAEMAELRGDLRTEMAELQVGLRTEMAELRGDLRTEMAELRGDVRTDLARNLRMQVGANLATMLTLSALIVGLT